MQLLLCSSISRSPKLGIPTDTPGDTPLRIDTRRSKRTVCQQESPALHTAAWRRSCSPPVSVTCLKTQRNFSDLWPNLTRSRHTRTCWPQRQYRRNRAAAGCKRRRSERMRGSPRPNHRNEARRCDATMLVWAAALHARHVSPHG